MKRKIIFSVVFCFIFLSYFPINVSAKTTCNYTYAYSEFQVGSEETNAAADGATIKLTIKDDGTNSAKVTKRADYGTQILFWYMDNSYSFGEKSSLENWDKKYCPLYIVTYANSTPWYGYDDKPDLSSFVKEKGSNSLPEMGMHIFMNDEPSIQTYSCHYDGFNIIFNEEGKALYAEDTLSSNSVSFHYDLDASLKDMPAVEPGVCENVYTCVTGLVSGSVYHYKVYSDSISLEEGKTKSECLDSVVTLFQVMQDEDSSEEGDNSACRSFSTHWDMLTTAHTTCSSGNSASGCNLYSNYKEKLRSWCGSITKYSDYDDGCLQRCLTLNTDIAKLENKKLENGKCGFSARLLTWVRNVLKWIKYIIPAIVIILGILDFIKAIASSNDDEFKKAQQRFIKRLIAAALLFVIPFIIEFALRIFNLGEANPYCGILD